MARIRETARLVGTPLVFARTPQEIAALAVYLASDESSYTTGQIHLADGGFAM